ncbi:hypothetical protein C8J57DRAFT_1534364 [Mycena rebaudengoi]|nr:hypothetical protein C8J57DRAFT_1534364 [Mycena rebaudengoi]
MSSPTSDNGNGLDDIFSAMAQSSPAGSDDDSDSEKDVNTGSAEPPVTGSANPNILGVAMNYAQQKRLRTEQKSELMAFLSISLFRFDPPLLHKAKSLVQALYIENMINKIIIATPPWTVSDDLNRNMYSFAAAILLSAKLSAYKGSTPKTILYTILKKHRFDLPVGIEYNTANWGKVIKAVQDAFTQLRSKFKKTIGKSYYSVMKRDGEALLVYITTADQAGYDPVADLRAVADRR